MRGLLSCRSGKEECPQATKLIVVQRVSQAMDADQVVVLDEGRVAGIGTHAQLLQDCPVYRDIALSQMTEDELGSLDQLDAAGMLPITAS